jgi:hypothetical protein
MAHIWLARLQITEKYRQLAPMTLPLSVGNREPL